MFSIFDVQVRSSFEFEVTRAGVYARIGRRDWWFGKRV
jgi:hypothetical protein